jgi:hypothetical protein
MTDDQQPGLGALPEAGSWLLAERGHLGQSPGAIGLSDFGRCDSEPCVSEPAPCRASLDKWAMTESETISVRHSMPADFPVMELSVEKLPSPDQLARRARLQRIVLALVAALGIFDVVMLWVYYR